MSGFDQRPEGHQDEPIDSLTTEPPVFGEPRASVLTPMGEIESIGDFHRGLGARRTKLVVFAFGGLVLVLALLAALR